MKTDFRKKLIYAILMLWPVFVQAQYNYHNWVENVGRDTAHYIEIWRISFQESINNTDSLLMDSLLIENQNVRISTTEKYWHPNGETFVGGNVNILQRDILPKIARFEYPDTALIKKNVFNGEGLLINSDGYFSSVDRPKYFYKSFKYDENNRLVEQIEIDIDGSNYYTYTYQFDDRNLTVRRNHLIENELAQYCIWKHDKKGNLESMANYWAKGEELEWRSTYEYRNKGRLIIEKRFDDEDIHKTSVQIQFDLNNNKVERVIYSADNEFEQGRYYSYDNMGNLTKDKLVVMSGENQEVKHQFEYSYDDQNKLLHRDEIDNNGNRTLVESFSYSSEGLLESSVVYNEKGIPEARFEYKYSEKE